MEDLSLRRIVPTDRESATILVLLVAMVLGLGYIGLSLAFWGTPGWGSPDPIPHVGLGNQVLADIGMSSTGYGFAVWTQKWGDGYRVLAARFLPDSGWTVGRPVDEGIGNGKIAKLAVSDGGDALVVWTDRGFQGTLWANRFIAGRDWGSPELLSHDDFSRIYFDFHAALDPGGSGIVAWSQFEEDSTLGREVGRMYTKRFDPAAGWQARDALGTGLVSDVLLANDGTAVLAWSWSTFQNVSRHPAGGSWSPPAILNPGGSGSAHPRLCVLAGDHLLAVWPDERNGAYGLWSSTYASSSGWSAPQPVPSGPAP